MDKNFVRLGLAVLISTEMSKAAFDIFKAKLVGSKGEPILSFVSEKDGLFFIKRKDMNNVLAIFGTL